MKEIIIPLDEVCNRCHDLERLEIKDGQVTRHYCQCNKQPVQLLTKEEVEHAFQNRLAEVKEEVVYWTDLQKKIETALQTE